MSKEKDLIAACVSAFLSIISISFIIFEYITNPRIRKHPFTLVVLRSVCDFGFVVSLVVATADQYQSAKTDEQCKSHAICLQFFAISAQAWFAVTIFDLLVTYRNPFYSSKRTQIMYHVFVWVSSVVFVVILVATESYGVSAFGMCWIRRYSSNFNPWSWVLFFVPTIVVFFSSCFVALYVGSGLRRSAMSSTSSGVMTTHSRTIRFCQTYILFFAVYWGVLALLYFVNWLHSFKLRGLTTTIIFGLGFRGFVDWMIVAYVDLSLNLGITIATKTSKRIEEKQKIADFNFQQAMRGDVMHATCQGILFGATRARLVAAAPPSTLSPAAPAFPAAVHFTERSVHHLEWREGQQSAQPEATNGTGSISSTTSTSTTRKFTFVDYAPVVFHTIRHCWGVTDEEYLGSFGKQSKSGVWDVSALVEKFSEGRSGAFFYFSHNRRFIIKTLSKTESRCLRRILPAYFEYMKRSPNSLLSRFHGCHAVTIHSMQRYFVVIDNLFWANKVHEVYDLKGSWIGRQAISSSSPRNTSGSRLLAGHKRKQKAAPGVLKDTDFRLKNKRLLVQPEIRDEMVLQLKKDAEHLATWGIMDFSLLVGIHNSSSIVQGDLDATSSVAASRATLGTPTTPTIPISSSTPLSTTTASTLDASNKSHASGFTVQTASSTSSTIPPATSAPSPEFGSSTPQESGWVGGASVPPLLAVTTSELDMPQRAMSFPARSGRDSKNHNSAHQSVQMNAPCLFRLDNGGLFSGFSRQKWTGTGSGFVYYIGIIDMLQEWNADKRAEHYTKTLLLRKDKAGLSAVPPDAYARRFYQKMAEIFSYDDKDKDRV